MLSNIASTWRFFPGVGAGGGIMGFGAGMVCFYRTLNSSLRSFVLFTGTTPTSSHTMPPARFDK